MLNVDVGTIIPLEKALVMFHSMVIARRVGRVCCMGIISGLLRSDFSSMGGTLVLRVLLFVFGIAGGLAAVSVGRARGRKELGQPQSLLDFGGSVCVGAAQRLLDPRL